MIRAIRGKLVLLSVGDGGELPSEFRLFVKGWNETENGRFLFDGAAAKSVMAAYREWGVDLAIDLEHQMLDGAGPDPTSRDARGWCQLELRPDGSLWAVNVRWTADGAARLADKRQRYVSPAFDIDPKTKRVRKMINVAITAMPATHNTPALVAASMKGSYCMDPKLIKQALEAIEQGDTKAAMELLKGMIADAAGAEPGEDGDEPGSEGDGAEGQPAAEAVEDPMVVDSAAPPPAPASDGGDEEDDEDKPEKKAAYKAMRAMLRRLSGKPTFAEAVAEAEVWRASHMTLQTERKTLAVARATLEEAERKTLAVALIKLGVEFPSTVWADDKATKLKPRLANMPIAELRSHVAEQKAARAKPAAKGGIKPAEGSDKSATELSIEAEVAQLSAAELGICKDYGTAPVDFVRLRRRQRAAAQNG